MSEIVVVMPTASTNRWFVDAVDSVLTDIRTDLRILVAFDGVEPLIKDRWRDSGRFTHLHSRERQGVMGTLSTAIASSNEPLVARLDADDLATVGRFEVQQRLLDDNPEVVMTASSATRIDGDDRVIGKTSVADTCDARGLLLKRNPVVHSSTMFRRSAYEAVGGFDTTLRHMEDYELWLRMASGGSLALMAREWVRYRVHPHQVSRRSPAHGPHITAISRARLSLARTLGVPATRAVASDFSWRAAQWLRHSGVRRSGFDSQETRL